MVLAIIFGAHMLRFGWLYKSKAYSVMVGLIFFTAITIGIIFDVFAVSLLMGVCDIHSQLPSAQTLRISKSRFFVALLSACARLSILS